MTSLEQFFSEILLGNFTTAVILAAIVGVILNDIRTRFLPIEKFYKFFKIKSIFLKILLYLIYLIFLVMAGLIIMLAVLFVYWLIFVFDWTSLFVDKIF